MINSFKQIFDLEIRFIEEINGYGVFTREQIKKGDSVEKCLCIELKESEHIGGFWDYQFLHPVTKNKLIPLGYGCTYNHSDTPNLGWRPVTDRIIDFYAIRDIEPGEQLFHTYGELWWRSKEKKLL